MLTEYRVIMHAIGFESKDALAGRARKLEQAQTRAVQVAEAMKAEGKTGYVIIRDHIKREVAQTYFVTEQQESGDDESENHDDTSGGAESQYAEVGTSRAEDVHRTAPS